MASSGKQAEASGNSNRTDEFEDGAPPSYEEVSRTETAGTSQAREAAATTESKRPYNGRQDPSLSNSAPGAVWPTVESPFNFPPAYSASSAASGSVRQDYSNLPEVVPGPSSSSFSSFSPYSPSPSSSSSKPILLAIPQLKAQPTSPFLPSYSTPILLPHGITSASFTSFLSALSAFLSASVSERALAHAGDVGRSIVTDIPKRFSRDTLAHLKDVSRGVADEARKGRIISAGVGAIAGAVTIPVAASVRLIHATIHQLPAAAVGSISKKPLSPRERADAYVAVAQRDWFATRGLKACLCSTSELLSLSKGTLGGGGYDNDATVKNLVNLMHRTWEKGPEAQLEALRQEFGFEALEITDPKVSKDKPLDIGAGTLWLVLTNATNY